MLSGVLFRTNDGISSIPLLDFDFNSSNIFFISNRDVGLSTWNQQRMFRDIP